MAIIKATAYIHGGDYDCSELVRMCYRAANVLPYGSYMWTGNEVALLTSNGFVRRSLDNPKRGDVLFRDGHTELYLGNNLQGGARMSEHGTITGTKGDQTGYEIAKSTYKKSDWSALYHYEGSVTLEGIPAIEVAAQVMEHVISHNAAHGYSQPNRAGDGTIEAITITYDDGSSVTIEWYPLEKKIKFTFNQKTNVRTSPSTASDANRLKVNGDYVTWAKGETATFDGIAYGSGFMFGTYIGPTTKKRLYAAMGTHELGTPTV